MTINQEDSLRPRLRHLDFQPITYEGTRYVHLRDPLALAQKTVLVPEPLIPLLPLLDGSHTIMQIQTIFSLRYQRKIGMSHIQNLVTSLDEALLLENSHYQQARDSLLANYLSAPSRSGLYSENEPPGDNGRPLKTELNSLTREYPTPAHVRLDTPIRGLISPHIDIPRGGPVYARTWGAASQAAQSAEMVIVLGTDHFSEGLPFSLTTQHYATPYGVLPTDKELVNQLAETVGEKTATTGEIHHRTEHSLEYAAIWLHHVREGKPVSLLPILCGPLESYEDNSGNLESSHKLTAIIEYLRSLVQSRPTLLVAAGDLSHVGPAFGGEQVTPRGLIQLKEADDLLLKSITYGDAEEFYQSIRKTGDQNNICGLSPIYLTMRILEPVTGCVVDYDACPADTAQTSFVSIAGVALT